VIVNSKEYSPFTKDHTNYRSTYNYIGLGKFDEQERTLKN